MPTTSDENLEEQLTGVNPAPASESVTKKTTSSEQRGAALLAEPSAIDLPLPSKSILYQNDPNLEDIKDGKVTVRPMTLRELELFLKPELTESGSLIDAVFRNCIKSNINPKYLLTSDRSFILIWIRAQSFGSEYRFKFQCSRCRQTISTKVDLSKLPIITLDNIHGKDENGEIKKELVKKIKEPFATELPHSGVTVHFTLARGIDESAQSTEQYYKRLKKDSSRGGSIERRADGTTVLRNIDPSAEEETSNTYIDEYDQVSLIDQLTRRVVKIEGVPDDRIEEALNHMVAGDITSLQQAIINADSGIDMELSIRCPDQNCKNENVINMPFTESFFRSSL